MDPLLVTAATALAAWLYLALGHGRFWQGDCELESAEPPPGPWPAVTAIVPARDEEACIVRSVSSLLEQDYPGDFRIVVVDETGSPRVLLEADADLASIVWDDTTQQLTVRERSGLPRCPPGCPPMPFVEVFQRRVYRLARNGTALLTVSDERRIVHGGGAAPNGW